ncbi:MAG: DNA polymerase III subunit delta, partial [Deltaproteobacteria bacterium]|nr:DNA polymerase III subunit delta [Deltaproteobacteria bacterium]
MKINFKRLRQDLKAGRFAPVYLFHGQEPYLIDRAWEATLEALPGSAADDFNLEILAASEVSPEEVTGRLAQLPLLGGRRVVAVKHLEKVKAEWLEGLLKVLENPLPESHLVLTAAKQVDARTRFFKAADKAGAVVQCRTPGEKELLAWLDEEAKARGKTFGPQAKMLLVTRVGQNLTDLAGEVEKLSLFVHPAGEISPEAVKAASAAWRGYTNFDLGDAVGRRDGLTALAILHHLLLAGEERKLGPLLVG